VIGQLAPQREIDDVCVEPEAALAIHACIEIESKRNAILDGAADGLAHRILDARVQQEHALVDVHVSLAHFEDAIEGIGETQAPGCEQEHAYRREPAAPAGTVPCQIRA